MVSRKTEMSYGFFMLLNNFYRVQKFVLRIEDLFKKSAFLRLHFGFDKIKTCFMTKKVIQAEKNKRGLFELFDDKTILDLMYEIVVRKNLGFDQALKTVR